MSLSHRSGRSNILMCEVSALVELPSHETAYSMFDEGANKRSRTRTLHTWYIMHVFGIKSRLLWRIEHEECLKVNHSSCEARAGSKGREISTTMCFAQILRKMMQACSIQWSACEHFQIFNCTASLSPRLDYNERLVSLDSE